MRNATRAASPELHVPAHIKDLPNVPAILAVPNRICVVVIVSASIRVPGRVQAYDSLVTSGEPYRCQHNQYQGDAISKGMATTTATRRIAADHGISGGEKGIAATGANLSLV